MLKRLALHTFVFVTLFHSTTFASSPTDFGEFKKNALKEAQQLSLAHESSIRVGWFAISEFFMELKKSADYDDCSFDTRACLRLFEKMQREANDSVRKRELILRQAELNYSSFVQRTFNPAYQNEALGLQKKMNEQKSNATAAMAILREEHFAQMAKNVRTKKSATRLRLILIILFVLSMKCFM